MCFLDGLQLWIPALCSRSLTVSTEQLSPRAGSTALAAVREVWVAKRTMASSCSLVVALLRPHLSLVSTVPSLSNLFNHLFTVLCCTQNMQTWICNKKDLFKSQDVIFTEQLRAVAISRSPRPASYIPTIRFLISGVVSWTPRVFPIFPFNELWTIN